MIKKHKTCRTIKNIHKYTFDPIWKCEISQLFKFKMWKISNKKIFNKKKEYVFGSQNLQHLQFIVSGLIFLVAIILGKRLAKSSSYTCL